MIEKQADAAASAAPEAAAPVPGILNLLGGDSAGMCIGGVCRMPGFDAQDAPKPE